MATLVTGGTGFVGSNIVRTLAERGHEVVCFDLEGPDSLVRKYVDPWSGRVSFVQGDILDQADLERAAPITISQKLCMPPRLPAPVPTSKWSGAVRLWA